MICPARVASSFISPNVQISVRVAFASVTPILHVSSPSQHLGAHRRSMGKHRERALGPKRGLIQLGQKTADMLGLLLRNGRLVRQSSLSKMRTMAAIPTLSFN